MSLAKVGPGIEGPNRLQFPDFTQNIPSLHFS